MVKRFDLRPTAAAFALALLVASCTASNPAEESQRTGEETSTFVIGENNLAATLDPAAAASQPDFQFAKAAYETLVNYDIEAQELQPALAESWEPDESFQEYTLTLREDVKFHDGSTLSAEGVKKSLERTIDLAKGESFLLSGVESIEAEDELTVTIRLSQPDPEFMHGLTRIFIVSAEAVESHDDGNQAEQWLATNEAGSGPYELVDFQPNSSLTLRAFEDYWRGWSGEHIDEYVIRVVPDPSTQLLQVERGELDWATEITIDDVARLKSEGDLQVETYPGSPVYIMLNPDGDGLQDPQVREAISMAVDYETVNEEVMRGMATRLSGPLPDWMPAHDDGLEPMKYDPQAAAELLEQAGYGESNPLRLDFMYFDGWSFNRTIATVVQDSLGQIGVDVRIEGAPWASFTELASKPETRPDMGVQAVFVPTASPAAVLAASFDPVNEGQWTYWGYENAGVTERLNTAKSETDADARTELYKDVQRILYEDYAAIWLMVMPDNFVLGSNVRGVEHDPMWGQVLNFYGVYKE